MGGSATQVGWWLIRPSHRTRFCLSRYQQAVTHWLHGSECNRSLCRYPGDLTLPLGLVWIGLPVPAPPLYFRFPGTPPPSAFHLICRTGRPAPNHADFLALPCPLHRLTTGNPRLTGCPVSTWRTTFPASHAPVDAANLRPPSYAPLPMRPYWSSSRMWFTHLVPTVETTSTVYMCCWVE